jgi:3-carboxy-cis,cis-muconate cycloisomerase
MSALDAGLISPVTVGHDKLVADAAVLDALVAVELALVRAYGAVGLASADDVEAISVALRQGDFDLQALAEASVAGGNPVIPLVGALKHAVPPGSRLWVHRGATSQDVMDSALMLVASRVVQQVGDSLAVIESALEAFARKHRDQVGAARTLTQHGVPTTMGLRAANWLRGIRRASKRVGELTLPAQLGGAGGTLAAFVEVAGNEKTVRALSTAFAAELGLAESPPWHTTRWPVTELGDALVQAIDAVGVIATDVATLSRTEIGELAEGTGGGSSSMPQKQNPVGSILVRSAALRAPHLGATLHLSSALAADERPDGAWHAEWPTLRELMRLALGASATATTLVAGLTVDGEAVTRNLAATHGLIVAERLSVVLGPVIGKERVADIVAAIAGGADAADTVADAIAGTEAARTDVAAVLDPKNYTGLAGALVDDALKDDE